MSLFKRSKAPEPAKPRRVSARRKAGVGPSQAAGATEVFAADVAWILWLAATAFLAAAFASFSPSDGGWFAVSTQVVPQNWFGRAGAVVADLFFFLFGISAVWWVVLFSVLALFFFRAASMLRRSQQLVGQGLSAEPASPWAELGWRRFGGFWLLLASSCALEAHRLELGQSVFSYMPGGALGSFVGSSIEWLVGSAGLTFLSLIGFFLGLSAFFHFTWLGFFEQLGRRLEQMVSGVRAKVDEAQDRKLGVTVAGERAERVLQKKARPEPKIEVMPVAEVVESQKVAETEFKAQQTPLFVGLAGSGDLPPLSLLEQAIDQGEPVSAETLEYTSRLIENRLADFGVEVRVVSAQPGPVITRYEIEPALGVKGSQIVNLSKDLARALSLTSVRVVETIPGKSLMGLELPNPRRQTVRLAEIIGSTAFQDSGATLPMALGKDIAGAPTVVDLAKMPHLLVAGTTGSGKSVGVNAMLLSLLYHGSADKIRLILIDPKMLELSIYEGIPHLLTPVVTDMKLAANALHWCVGEMERRYRLMSKLNTRNLAGFNAKVEEALKKGKPLLDPLAHPEMAEAGQVPPLAPLPQIVVVIDELADLMMVVGKKVEELIARLAQKARAAGIHLILATQRPSVDVITGLIKANIPSRISFQVSSRIDSRTVLDQMGAEALLGMGDMLFLSAGSGVPTRVHGAFVADDEVFRVVSYLKEQAGGAQYNEAILDGAGESGGSFTAGLESIVGGGAGGADGEADALYDEAVAVVLKHRRASISLVQRHLRIGYNRAARLLESMEQAGVVSAMQSNGNRDILVPAGNE